MTQRRPVGRSQAPSPPRLGLVGVALVSFAIIGTLFFLIYGAAWATTLYLGVPPTISLPWAVRLFGVALLAASLGIVGWLFAYRRPTDMVRSTYTTFTKLFGRAPVAEPLGRTEPLLLVGPQRYVRHPLYLSVLLALFGWGLFTNSSVGLLETAPFLLWFVLVQIPFEERELRALYGEAHSKYCERTRMLIPFGRRVRQGS